MKEYEYSFGPNKKQICFFIPSCSDDEYYCVFCRGLVLSHISDSYDDTITIGVPDNKIFANYIVQLQDLLDKFSKRFKTDKIKIFNQEVTVSNHAIYEIKLNSFWLHSPFNISFFTFILRTLAMYHSVNNTLRQTIYGFKTCNYDDLKNKNISHSKIFDDKEDYVNSFNFIVKFMNHGNEIFYKTMEENFECFPQMEFEGMIGFAYIARGESYYYDEDDDSCGEVSALKYFHREMNKEKIAV